MAPTNYRKLGLYSVQDESALRQHYMAQADELAGKIEDIKAKGATDLAIVFQSAAPMQRDAVDALVRVHGIQAEAAKAIGDNLSRIYSAGMPQVAALQMGNADPQALVAYAPTVASQAALLQNGLASSGLEQKYGGATFDAGSMRQELTNLGQVALSTMNQHAAQTTTHITDPTSRLDTTRNQVEMQNDAIRGAFTQKENALRRQGLNAQADVVKATADEIVASQTMKLEAAGINAGELAQRSQRQVENAKSWAVEAATGARAAGYNVPDELEEILLNLVRDGVGKGMNDYAMAKAAIPNPQYLIERYNQNLAAVAELVPGTDAVSRAREDFISKIPAFNEIQAVMGFSGPFAREEAASWMATHPTQLRELIGTVRNDQNFANVLNNIRLGNPPTAEMQKQIGDNLRGMGIPTSDFGRSMGVWVKPKSREEAGSNGKISMATSFPFASTGYQSDGSALEQAQMERDLAAPAKPKMRLEIDSGPKVSIDPEDDGMGGLQAERTDKYITLKDAKTGDYRATLSEGADGAFKILGSKGVSSLDGEQGFEVQPGSRAHDAVTRLLAGYGKEATTAVAPTDTAPAATTPKAPPAAPKPPSHAGAGSEALKDRKPTQGPALPPPGLSVSGRASQLEEARAALADPNTPPEVRADLEDMVRRYTTPPGRSEPGNL